MSNQTVLPREKAQTTAAAFSGQTSAALLDDRCCKLSYYQRDTSLGRTMNKLHTVGKQYLEWIQDIGLFLIAIATVIALGFEVNHMVAARVVTLADLLLMFIYLEVLAMVSIYLESGKLPIRIPLYIAIVALARYLILDMKNMSELRMLAVSAAALLVAITVLIIRYGHIKLPYGKEHD
jgi:protein PsiE